MNGQPVPRAGWWTTVRAVLWSFAGVRRGQDYRQDAERLDLRLVIAVGVVAGLVFVGGLVAVVLWITAV